MTSTARKSSRSRPDEAAEDDPIDFKALAESTSDVIIRCGQDAVATYVSPAVRQLLGLEPEELIGRSHVAYVVPDDLPGLMKTVAAHHSGAADGRATFRMTRKDGAIVWVEGSGRLVTDPATGSRDFVIVLRDISERKALEAQLSLLALTYGTMPAPVRPSEDRHEPGQGQRSKERPRTTRLVN